MVCYVDDRECPTDDFLRGYLTAIEQADVFDSDDAQRLRSSVERSQDATRNIEAFNRDMCEMLDELPGEGRTVLIESIHATLAQWQRWIKATGSWRTDC